MESEGRAERKGEGRSKASRTKILATALLSAKKGFDIGLCGR